MPLKSYVKEEGFRLTTTKHCSQPGESDWVWNSSFQSKQPPEKKDEGEFKTVHVIKTKTKKLWGSRSSGGHWWGLR